MKYYVALFLTSVLLFQCIQVHLRKGPELPKGAPIGIDVSHYDTLDWTTLGKNIDFVFIKATEGVTLTDPDFKTNWVQAKHNGILRGAFCLFHPIDNPIQEAKYFLDQVGPLAAGDLPPVLDLEKTDGLSSKKVVQAALVWLQYVKQQTGQTPIIYVSPLFMGKLGNPVQFQSYPLWEADWNVQAPDFILPWTTWTFWQFTDSGKVPGAGAIDRDVFNGTFDNLEKLLVP